MFIPTAWLIIFFILLVMFLIFLCWCFFVVCRTPGQSQYLYQDDPFVKQNQEPKVSPSIKLEVETIKIRQLEVMVESTATNLRPFPTAPAAEDINVDKGGGGEGGSCNIHNASGTGNNSAAVVIQSLDTPDLPKMEGHLSPKEDIDSDDKKLETKNEQSMNAIAGNNCENVVGKRKNLNQIHETMI